MEERAEAVIGTLLPHEVEEMLRRHRTGRIGCSANDRPYVVPINYAYDGANIYAYSTLGRKIQVMREQPLVCFEIDEIAGPSRWRSVIAEGVYEELTADDERLAAVTPLAASGPDLAPVGINGNGLHQVIVFRIRLTEKSGQFERRDA